MLSPIIQIEHVNYTFGRDDEPVLRDVNLTVCAHDFVWIVGPNGGGKTTLLRLILGLYKLQTGHITIFGGKPGSAQTQIGYMPQHARLDLRFPATVMDVTLMGRLGLGSAVGPFRSSDRKAAMRALKQVKLDHLARKTLRELSGGQQRRLLIARALAGEPKLLILDEPTANLDRRAEEDLFGLLRALNERLTIVMVSHDPAFVSEFVPEVVCVNQTVAVHPTGVLESEFLHELYSTPVRVVRHDQHRDEGHH